MRPTSSDPHPSRAPEREIPFRGLVWMFAVALALRLAGLAFLGSWSLSEFDDPGWRWAYEQGAIAQSLAHGGGFADTFLKGSGPTAWAAPAYPLLLGALLRVGGGITPTAALLVYLCQALISAATCPVLARLGTRVAGARTGRLAGWLLALDPAAMYYAVFFVWDTTLVTFAITAFLAALVRDGERATRGRVAWLGALFGLVLLTNPAPLALVPLVLWYLVRHVDGWAARARHVVPFGLAAAAVCSPWCVRNAIAVGSPGIRSNLGVEFFVGNNDGADGSFNPALHPSNNDEEYAAYVAMGEVPYADHCMQRFLAWARAHPARFAGLVARRVQLFWVGGDPNAPDVLMSGEVRPKDWRTWSKWLLHALTGVVGLAGLFLLRRGSPEGWLVRGTVLVFPLVYYVTHVLERYRFPIEPLLILSCAVLVWRLLGRLGAGSRDAVPSAAARSRSHAA